MEPVPLQYFNQRRRPKWRLPLLVALLVICAAVSMWRGFGRTALQQVQMYYWQRKCLRFQGAPGTYAADPSCWLNYRPALQRDEGFMGGTVIFLHECVSPQGTRRLVALRMRPNIDHAQMCSVDATVVVPATLTIKPTSRYGVVSWVPGWSGEVKWNQLHWARLDPADPSHIVFSYDAPEIPWDATSGGSANVTMKPTTLDFWLHDDGTVTTEPNRRSAASP